MTGHWLWIIFGAALGLRLWGIAFGLPDLFHQDELMTVKTALSFGQGIGAVDYPHHPHLFHELLFVGYAAAFLVGKGLGLWSSSAAYLQQFLQNPAPWVLGGRLMAAGFGAATPWLLYRTVRETGAGEKTALWSAAALAVCFLHVRDSHYCRQDIPALFFGVGAAWFALRAMLRGGRRDSWGAGLWTGLAMGMNWNFALWLPGLLLAHGLKPKGTPKLRPALEAVGIALACFALVNPAILLHAGETAGTLGRLAEGAGGVLREPDTPWTAGGWWRYLIVYLPVGVSWIGLLAGGIGWVGSLRKPSKPDLWLTAGMLAYGLLIGSYTRSVRAAYILPLAPFVLYYAVRWMEGRPVRLRALLLAGLFLSNGAAAVRHDWLLTRPDTRRLAREWVEAHVPSGTMLAVDHGRTFQAWVPQLLETAEQSAQLAAATRNSGKGSGLWWSARANQAAARPRYRLIELIPREHLIPEMENGYDLDRLQRQGVTWVILSDFVESFVETADSPKQDAFYARLRAGGRPVVRFTPYDGQTDRRQLPSSHTPLIDLWRLKRPGPVIELYALEPGP
ncbi:MAG: hypothetical protein COV76_01715 [Candidatus Omnitrophica bacterium CG11_big_fil_rev_8_21_14_0_20_64_10]|nr:MAG: hypothetical protein COV76_01715 [Candidatus Omnitrophica bacterium CG11_big_fil_rev_8_21_14_0_20_64_10]